MTEAIRKRWHSPTVPSNRRHKKIVLANWAEERWLAETTLKMRHPPFICSWLIPSFVALGNGEVIKYEDLDVLWNI